MRQTVNLTSILSHRNGLPHRYWRIGTTHGNTGTSEWQAMLQGGYAGIGWNRLSDLSHIEYSREGKEKVRSLLNEHFENSPQMIGRNTNEIFFFVSKLQVGDLLLASKGNTVLGIGKVEGDYFFSTEGGDFHHRRPVKWLSTESWKVPISEGLRTTLKQLTRHPENLIEVERRLLERQEIPKPTVSSLDGIPGRIQKILQRKSQVVLYGPPGTGKTYWAEITARELAARSWFNKPYSSLANEERKRLIGDDDDVHPIEICCFHPAYGYEDFLEGLSPVTKNDNLVFELRDGLFKRICDHAVKLPTRNFYLIIDEINRGDIPRVFGELLTVLEKNKRGMLLHLAQSGRSFSVPDNVYILATMNTADRSIALLDTALRRRFGFVELMPDSQVLGNKPVGGVPLGPWLDELNRRLIEHAGQDARNLQIGHAYLLEGGLPISKEDRFAEIVHDDIVPLLSEYCYEDFGTLEKVLGQSMVDRVNQRIREELFHIEHRDELFRALLESCPGITASSQAVTGDSEAENEDTADDEDDAEE